MEKTQVGFNGSCCLYWSTKLEYSYMSSAQLSIAFTAWLLIFAFLLLPGLIIIISYLLMLLRLLLNMELISLYAIFPLFCMSGYIISSPPIIHPHKSSLLFPHLFQKVPHSSSSLCFGHASSGQHFSVRFWFTILEYILLCGFLCSLFLFSVFSISFLSSTSFWDGYLPFH